MSRNHQKIEKFYKAGFYTKDMLKYLVGKKSGITEEEYREITGEDYDPE